MKATKFLNKILKISPYKYLNTGKILKIITQKKSKES